MHELLNCLIADLQAKKTMMNNKGDKSIFRTHTHTQEGGGGGGLGGE